MHRLDLLFILGLFLVLLAPPRAAHGCPACAEAVPADSGAEAQDQARLARAYNSSIYLMVAVPYLALGTVGFLVYRRLRVHAAGQQRLVESARALPPGALVLSPGDSACPFDSRDGIS